MSQHKWSHWKYLVLNGRIRKKAIDSPRRERLMVRDALRRLGYRYREVVPVLNPEYGGWKNENKGAIQWLDFVVLGSKGIFVLLFTPNRPNGGIKEYEKISHEAKKSLLDKKGIRYLELRRTETSQIYQMLISRLEKEVK